ncbi:hypothetical protein ACQP2U_43635 (plasmid) [Nocardia sp. CA-084685]|uniref:hypothetical protein n=1 Tax=Nocardia sp. CA-084685 TaxID=3239970 RepID=UPI003D992FBC
MSYDYRTEHTLSVSLNDQAIYSNTSMGSPDTFQLETEIHYALIYARILNPNIPADTPVAVESRTVYGRIVRDRKLSAHHPHNDYLIPEVLARHGKPAA